MEPMSTTFRKRDRCDFQKMYGSAKLMYASILNGAVLTTTLAHLVEFQAAVDSPTRPSRLMSGGRFMPPVSSTKCSKLAQVCALKLMKTPEVVEELLHLYEGQGYGEQLTDLVEASLGSEGRNTDLFTDTSLFAEALIDYLKMYWERINTPKIIRICEETHLWTELVFFECLLRFDPAGFGDGAGVVPRDARCGDAVHGPGHAAVHGHDRDARGEGSRDRRTQEEGPGV
ncbi:MAG: hypothetical protein BYD32DRAFT_467956 [Podila humilis]|nr:MAG: hypothetical protein BYD32DRAFT_467956 [Podila humilis]